MLTPLFDLLFLGNDLQEQWSDEVSVDINYTRYDATEPWRTSRAINDATIAKRRQISTDINGDNNDAKEPQHEKWWLLWSQNEHQRQEPQHEKTSTSINGTTSKSVHTQKNAHTIHHENQWQ